jgi:hypothetical protein
MKLKQSNLKFKQFVPKNKFDFFFKFRNVSGLCCLSFKSKSPQDNIKASILDKTFKNSEKTRQTSNNT